MNVCDCGNVLARHKPKGFTMVSKPCRCKQPGPGRVAPARTQLRLDPNVARDPNRRRLGLPHEAPYEIAVRKGWV